MLNRNLILDNQDFVFSRNSSNSDLSFPEITADQKRLARYFYLLLSFIASILGLKIIYTNKLFNEINEFHFSQQFLIFYTYTLPIILLLVAVTNIISYTVNNCNQKCFQNCFSEKKAVMVNYILIFLITCVLVLHIVSLPITVYILFELSNATTSYIIYLFLAVILVLGLTMTFVLIYYLFCYKNPVKKKQFCVDESYLIEVVKEIDRVKKVSGIYPSNNGYDNQRNKCYNTSKHQPLVSS